MNEFKLSTEVEVRPSDWKLGHRSKTMTIGSCFAEVLGSQLSGYKFNVLNNPVGTVFNPLTICKILDSALDQIKPNPDLYLETPDKIWLHHDFHSSIWAKSKEELESVLTQKLADIRTFLKETDLLVITFGTAYAYRHKATNQVIGNCHKLPADRFVKELLHQDQIYIALERFIQKLLAFRRTLRVVFTVSPVRHTKDTLPLNQVSKSTLRLICHRLSEKYKHIEYFPSYEIMVDELRDYRFYKEDLIHPGKLAEDYIFKIFGNAYLHPESIQFMKEWDSVTHAMQHRPLHGATESQLKLLRSVSQKLALLASDVDVSAEQAEIENRIKQFPAL